MSRPAMMRVGVLVTGVPVVSRVMGAGPSATTDWPSVSGGAVWVVPAGGVVVRLAECSCA